MSGDRHIQTSPKVIPGLEVDAPSVGVESIPDGVNLIIGKQSVVLSPFEAQLLASLLVNAATLAESIERHPSNRG